MARSEVNILDFTGETYCFSATNDFTGCPPSGVPGDGNDVLDYAAPNRRLLLKREETFTHQETSIMGEGPLLISAFGTGEKPIIHYNGPDRLNPQNYAPIYLNGDNVSISVIDFRLWHGDNAVHARGGGNAPNLLLLRVDFDNILNFGNLMIFC